MAGNVDDAEAQLAALQEKRKKATEVVSDIDAKIADLRAATRGTVLEATKKAVAEYRFTAVELFGASYAMKPKAKANGTRGPVVVKYRDEHGNTWGGGKGPRPAWVKAIQEAGGDLEKHRVIEAAAPDRKAAAQRLADAGGKAPEAAEISRRRSS